MTNKLAVLSIMWLMICAAMPARAEVIVSTHCFTNCGFPDTGQKICYNTTAAIACPAPGNSMAQDGSYAPSATQPSYTVYSVDGSRVTVDNRTGLMWITDSGGVNYTWGDALAICEDLTFANYSDWRLPNVRELMSIVDYSTSTAPTINLTYFPGTQASFYWSSTSYAPDAESALGIDFSAGYVGSDDKVLSSNYVRCVRGGP